ncbi:hypothetical protein GCM10028791_09190 [Echinicola sediminis]
MDNISLTYKIYSQGLMQPHKEWSLTRTVDGNFVSSVKDNLRGVNTSYNVTEFTRGDIVQFKLSNELEKLGAVAQGDTIGYIESNEEQRKLAGLRDELGVLNSELMFFTTGQKQEDIEVIQEQLNSVKQDFRTQEVLYERSLNLYEDSVISKQDIEILSNQLKLKEYEVLIKSAELSSARTGEKSEQEKLIRSKIELIKNQMQKIEERIDHFTIVSPFSGVLMKNSGTTPDMMKLNVYDNSSLMALAPVEIYDREFMELDQEVIIYTKSDRKILEGRVVKLDNVIQKLNNRQVFFVTAQINTDKPSYVGELTELEVVASEISTLEYLKRSFQKIISR